MDSQRLIDQQLNILRFLYRFRFLTSSQIRHLLKHNNIRITNYHLKHLFSNNYIGRHYSRSLSLGNQPAVYYLASRSIGQLKELERIDKRALRRIYREKNRSQQFILHASFMANYYLYLCSESEKTSHTLHFFTKTDLMLHPYFIHPLPDAYFARVDKKGNTKRYFLEVVDDTSPRFALRKRVEQYNDYLESGRFEEVTRHPFPKILFICLGVGVLIYLKKHIARIWEETSLDQTGVYLTTQEGAFTGRWDEAGSEEE